LKNKNNSTNPASYLANSNSLSINSFFWWQLLYPFTTFCNNFSPVVVFGYGFS